MASEAATVERIVRYYRRRCWWADVDDLRQEAVLATLLARRSFDARVGVPWESYLRAAVNRWLSGYLWRQSSPVSGAAGAAARGLHRTVLSETMVDGGLAPDEAAVETEWRHEVQTRFAEIVGSDTEMQAGLAVLLRDERPTDGLRIAVRRARGALAGDLPLYCLIAHAR